MLENPVAGHDRRELFRRGGLLAAAVALGGRLQRAAAAPLEYGANLYRSIGVRPLLNTRRFGGRQAKERPRHRGCRR